MFTVILVVFHNIYSDCVYSWWNGKVRWKKYPVKNLPLRYFSWGRGLSWILSRSRPCLYNMIVLVDGCWCDDRDGGSVLVGVPVCVCLSVGAGGWVPVCGCWWMGAGGWVLVGVLVDGCWCDDRDGGSVLVGVVVVV